MNRLITIDESRSSFKQGANICDDLKSFLLKMFNS